MSDMWQALARFCSRRGAWVIMFWLALAIAGNVLVPQLESVVRDHSRSFLPADSPSSVAVARMGEIFKDSGTNNLAYVVLESSHDLGVAEHRYYDALVAKLAADKAHVEAVMDLWSDPLSGPVSESSDKKVAHVLLRLKGQLGTTAAYDSIKAVRSAVSNSPTPSGLSVFVSGPGPTVADELSSIDGQLIITIISTALVIAVLMYVVYRSAVTSRIPLIPVAAALAVARPAVALLGQHNAIEVSIFSQNLLASMTLGAVTNYGIFMVGRYHEQRRKGLDVETSLEVAYRSVAPVIVASALTIALALSTLSFAKLGLLRSAGMPCAISVLIGMLAALTLVPAVLGAAGRRGLAEPRPLPNRRRWRRVGVAVARWPGPTFAAGIALLLVLAAPVLGMRVSFDELKAQPKSTESNRGYQAMDRHFPPNRLLPEIVAISTDHDLRTPAGLIAIERVARKILEQNGVQLVQAASRPAGAPLEEATITSQAAQIGDHFGEGVGSITSGLTAVDKLSGSLADTTNAIDRLQSGLAGAVNGLRQVSSGTADMVAGVHQLQASVGTVSGYVDPLRTYTNSKPDCAADPVCSLVLKVIEPMNSVVASAAYLSAGAGQLANGSNHATGALSGAAASISDIRRFLGQAHEAMAALSASLTSLKSQFGELAGYLHGMGQDFRESGAGGFYLPQSALQDSRFQHASQFFFSDDGRTSRILVFGLGEMFGNDGARLSNEIEQAIHATTKEGALAGNTVLMAGVGSVVRELQLAVQHDFLLLATVALVLIFMVVMVMLRAPLAALSVVATVILSYVSAIGLSVVYWQFIIGRELHWAVPSIAFIALVAVGADYNLLLTARLKEESAVGLRTGMVRTFDGTGGVVTSAGIVFGLTMFALMRTNILSIAQVGTTVGLGLMLDTLIVRALVVPGLAGMLGRWFWWPFPLRHSRTGLAPHPARRTEMTPNTGPGDTGVELAGEFAVENAPSSAEAVA
jgi:putative drug exporter of the RND superfamily